MKFEAVIGLEVHSQLATNTKIFCGCSNKFGAKPNTNVCPVCLGMPGVLPVLNEKVVENTLLAGLALNCRIAEKSIFARKNYFYPDLPKGYQTSQYELPICIGGYVDIQTEEHGEKRVNLTRIHIEEDAGKLMHGESLGSDGHSYVDLNRTGTPLIEIVSEPELRSGAEAREYLQNLKSIIEYIGVSDCNMEEGSFRCDANVSVRPFGQKEFGTKAEIKNMNSIRNVQRAIDFEIKRQIHVIENGGKVVQETRLWDADKGESFSMRGKEEAHDYRYFPCPDLVPLVILDEMIEAARKKLPELPEARKQRVINEYSLREYDAGIITSVRDYADYFEAVVKACGNAKSACNWLTGDVLKLVKDKDCPIFETGVTPEMLGEIIKLVDDGKISAKNARDVFFEVSDTGKTPSKIVEEKGLVQVSDEGELESIVQKLIDENQDAAERYKAGDKKLQGFFVGQVMKATKGKANPKVVNELLNKLIK